MKTKESDSDLAIKWKCHARTIRRWRTDGAPLHDAKAMRAWLSDRSRPSLRSQLAEIIQLAAEAGL